jgi:lipopolysaccharide/colanic/teichoic acid biosynthesis glycosyltransferase
MYQVFKRFVDFIISLIALPFLFVIFLFVAIAIKLDDHGPVFYSAKRIGRNGKLFKMIKFRSMKVNAPDIRLADGSTYNGDDDPRVTRVGKFIRKTSIDELPQILNVFVGQMSIIGPRPDPEDWLDKYTEEERVFLKVRPGITGYSQAYFRNDADGKEKIKNDVYYAQNCSLWLDIKIFFKTIATVLKRENTYKDMKEETAAQQEVEKLRLESASTLEDKKDENN